MIFEASIKKAKSSVSFQSVLISNRILKMKKKCRLSSLINSSCKTSIAKNESVDLIDLLKNRLLAITYLNGDVTLTESIAKKYNIPHEILVKDVFGVNNQFESINSKDKTTFKAKFDAVLDDLYKITRFKTRYNNDKESPACNQSNFDNIPIALVGLKHDFPWIYVNKIKKFLNEKNKENEILRAADSINNSNESKELNQNIESSIASLFEEVYSLKEKIVHDE